METGLISSGNRSHFFMFFTTFYQQLMVATSSGTVNELSAFKNLFHLVCPYFTDHARIANKSKFTESMQIILYVTRFYRTEPNRTSGKIKLTPPVDSYTIVLQVLTLSTTQTTRGWF